MEQKPRMILAVHILTIATSFAQDSPTAFVKGADVSFLAEIEDMGGKFYENGVSKDALDLFKDHGFNYVRLKIWHSPAKNYNTLEKVLLTAKRAKAKGFRFLLNFHYSDWWADPQKQIKPAAWKNLSFEVLQDSVARYTRLVLTLLKRQGVLPDMVQIGNEITPGMLWDDGKVGGEFDTEEQWRKLALLIQSGITGVQSSLDSTEKVQIMIHLDRGGDNKASRWFFDHLLAHDVKFDVIGLSFYPKWHGTFADLKHNLHDLASRYPHDLVIVETGYPWTLQWTERGGFDRERNIFGRQSDLHAGYAASVAGQKAFLQDLIRIVKETPKQKGK
ncbi:glycosyl hydrolase 53 family protein, partial [candidate division KSB1 bacterium]|nr:glycosyl hydrolase 53 family protein [candidate division KSB1 bacterium]